jgi:RNA polymerase sigma-70 factor (ECF subfamily)
VVAGQLIVSDLIAGARSQEDALETAVREHARLVYRVAYSVLRNHHDAEDATQETFVRVMRYRGKLGGVRDVKNWLARVAYRVALDRRKKQPEVALEDASETVAQLRSTFARADDIVIGGQMTELLQRLIGGLQAKLRDVVTLSTLEEMSPADVAKVLGTREAAVRSRLFRGRQILKEKLTKLLEGKHGA